MTGALYTLLAVFLHYAVKKEPIRDVQMTYVRKAQDYIQLNYSYPITIEDVASYVGISRSYLFRSFQVCLKQSPKEYLTDFRIQKPVTFCGRRAFRSQRSLIRLDLKIICIFPKHLKAGRI